VGGNYTKVSEMRGLWGTILDAGWHSRQNGFLSLAAIGRSIVTYSILLSLLPVGRILSVRFDSLKTMEILLTWIEAVEVREFTASLNLQNPSHLIGSDRHLTRS